jgi:hypothetical protein
METGNKRYVLIHTERSANEKAEAFLFADFNARYRKMSRKERKSEEIQDELDLLWEIKRRRDRKNRVKIRETKRKLLEKGLIGLTEEEWEQYRTTGRAPRPRPVKKVLRPEGFDMLVEAARRSRRRARAYSKSEKE